MKKSLLSLALAATLSAPAFAAEQYLVRVPANVMLPSAAPEVFQAPEIVTDFKNLQMAIAGLSQTGTHTLTNNNPVAVNLGTPASNLSLAGTDCGNTLPAGQRCTLTYSWAPAKPGDDATATFSMPWSAKDIEGTLSQSTPIHARVPAIFDYYWGGEAARIANGVTYTNNNRTVFFPAGASKDYGVSSVLDGKITGVKSGKWYLEITPSKVGQSKVVIGVGDSSSSIFIRSYGANQATGYWSIWDSASNVLIESGNVSAINDTIGMLIDADARKVSFVVARNSGCMNLGSRSNVVQAGGYYIPWVYRESTDEVSFAMNAGQAPFKCQPPVGYISGLW